MTVKKILNLQTMKSFKHTVHVLIATTLVAWPLIGFGAEEKNSALMEPVKSVLDHYLSIQTDWSFGAR